MAIISFAEGSVAVDPRTVGWGAFWGNAWGDNLDLTTIGLQLLAAIPIAENMVRLVFSEAPSFTMLLDAGDASRRERYSITANTGTFGMDGLVSRPVQILYVEQNMADDPLGRFIDLTIDRPFSPDPASYTVTVNGLVTAVSSTPLDSGAVMTPFLGVSRYISPPNPETATPSRDFSNPQTLSMLVNATGEQTLSGLGTHPVDSTGDYATDDGVQNLKKRVFRRLMTAKGAFLHAPGYGVDIPGSAARLNVPSVREGLAADAESQISQEPDVKRVRVTVATDPLTPNVARFTVLVRTTSGNVVKFEAPFTS
jgi:hypothetical protein